MLKVFNNLTIAAFVAVLMLSLVGCGNNSTSNSVLDFNAFPASYDVQLGSQLDSQMTADPINYPILNNDAANAYVQNIVNSIINSQYIQYKGTFAYKSKIIRNDSIVNAFCTPGGYIYVYTGLLKFIDNEATLAGVLGHEIAHAELRHVTRRMTKAYGVQFLLNLVLGNNPNQYEQLATNLFTGLAFLKNSRDDETQADEYSFKYLQSSIWYPGGILYFFDKVKTGDQSFLTELLSDHPLTDDRIQHVKDLIAAANLAAPTENNLFTQRYTTFKMSLP